MKKIGRMLVILLLVISMNAFANDYPELQSWVNDYAEVFTGEQQEELDTILKDFEDNTTTQIFVAIMDRIPAGFTLEDYATKLFNHWGIGQKENDNGVLFLVFISDRKLRIEVGYGLEEPLTNEICADIIQEAVVPDFKEGDYYSGIKKGVQRLILTIDEEYR